MKILKMMFVLMIVLVVAGFSVLALSENKETNEKAVSAVLI